MPSKRKFEGRYPIVAELRKAHAAPVFDNLEVWLAMQLTMISGKSPLETAIRYALSRMERLRPYLDHGILELDKNAAERGMRAIALGRKNYLFVGSEAGGKAAAIAYTMIETALCRARHKAVYADRRTMPINQLFANVSGTIAAA